MNTRIAKEETFHDKRFGAEEDFRAKVNKYYAVNEHVMDHYVSTVTKFCHKKKLLEYGCGTGSWSEKWLELGAEVTGIDLSSEGIKKAKENNTKLGKSANYFVMNAEKTDFPNNSFDIIVGTGILHHLNLVDSYSEISRILVNTGHAIFVEPLGHNPLIQAYRALTPHVRTEDEHPLKIKDIELLKKYFGKVEVQYFSLFTLAAVPFRKFLFFKTMYLFLQKMDRMFFVIPFVKKYAWTAVIHVYNPIK